MVQDPPLENAGAEENQVATRLLASAFCALTLVIAIQSNGQVPVLFDSEPLVRRLVMPALVTLTCGCLFLLHRMSLRRQVTSFDLCLTAIPTVLIGLRAFGVVSPWVLTTCATLLAIAFARVVLLLAPGPWYAPRWAPITLWVILAIGGVLVSFLAPISGFQFIGALSIGLLWLGLVLFGASVLLNGHWWRRLLLIGLLGVFF